MLAWPTISSRGALARAALGCLSGVAIAHTAACSDDFTPRYVVDKTRILAVRASAPRLEVGQATRISALVASENADDEFERSWELCPFTRGDEEGYVCEYPTDVPPELLSFLRSDARTFDFTYIPDLQPLVDLFCEPPAEVLDQLPEGISLPDCSSGFPARVRLAVRNPRTGEEAIAVKTLYLVPSDPDDQIDDNDNPLIAELAADPQDGAPDQPVVGEAFDLRCLVDQSSLDEFVRFDEDAPRPEEVQLSWFVRSPANADGDHPSLDESRTFFSLEDGDPEEAQRNELTVRTPGPVSVWCVVRDGRGGTDWKRLDLTASP